MRVWLLKSGEPLPTDEGVIRLHRVGILAKFLADRGHQVTWWTSTFDHYRKRQRAARDTRVVLPDGVELLMLRGCGYRNNVSLSRIREHAMIAKRFTELARLEPRPDVILSAYPTLEMSVAATRYGREHGVPVIVDIRDLWPDLILDLVPAWARRVGKLALSFMWKQARESCTNGTAICGTSEHFVEWGLRRAEREKGPLDRDFPFGYLTSPPTRDHLDRADQLWSKLGVRREDNVLMACFFGSMERQFSLDTVIEAARILEDRGCRVKFVLCGGGTQLNALREQAAGLASVSLPGWVHAPAIWTLMRMADVGLAPYLDKPAFSANFPNKTIEYLSAGLPVVASLHGDFEQFLTQARCGLTYPLEDPLALADTLAKLASDRALLASLAKGAASVFHERFVAERVYAEMCDYLQIVAAKPSPAALPQPAAARSAGERNDVTAAPREIRVAAQRAAPSVSRRSGMAPPLKVWLVKVGEPLPGDADPGRPYRMGMVAKELCERGHDVTWWSSTFNHATKRFRPGGRKEENFSETFRVIQLHGCAYDQHVSVARLRNHRQEAAEFAREAVTRPRPDLILCAYPTIDLSVSAVRYGNRRRVPVVLDVRDLWPDIFLDIVPDSLRPLGRVALEGLFSSKAYAFRNATAVLGTSESFVDWGVTAASRARGDLDRAFPHGYPEEPLTAEQRVKANEFWRAQFGGDFPKNIMCFFGNFSEHVLDLETVVGAARVMEQGGEPITFVLCGTGPSHAGIREMSAGLRTVVLPGRIGLGEIRVLMEHSVGGLVPYLPRWDLEASLPNKVIEYLSSGLPILTCLGGELQRLVKQNGCGALYKHGDVEGFVKSARSLIETESAREALRASATRLFETAFRAEDVYAEYVLHLERVAARTASEAARKASA